MKTVPVFTVLSALLAGAVAWHQNLDTRRLEKQARTFTAELAVKDAVVQEQETLLNTLQKENDGYRSEIDSLHRETDIEASPAPARSKNNTAEMLARISDDPKMKEVVRQWNSATIKEIYGDFVKDRHLNPIQTKQFFDLLTEERARAKDEYFSLFATGEADTGPTETRIDSWMKEKSAIEEQLRMLLGNDDYAEFEEYRTNHGN